MLSGLKQWLFIWLMILQVADLGWARQHIHLVSAELSDMSGDKLALNYLMLDGLSYGD